jgi:hypothetical protein
MPPDRKPASRSQAVEGGKSPSAITEQTAYRASSQETSDEQGLPMMLRTSQRTVAFRRPFLLEALGEELPAGNYCVETEEELVEGISYAAYRRSTTVLLLPAAAGTGGFSRALTIDPQDLETALERDQLTSDTLPACASQEKSPS